MARLTKSRNHWIQGVLGGIGAYFNVNPDLIRVCFLVALFILDLNVLIPAYIILMIIMPEPNKAQPEEVIEEIHTPWEKGFRKEYNSGRALQVLGAILILAGISFILRYQFPGIWFSLHDYMRVVRHTFSDFREILVGLLLIVVGYFLLVKPKRG